eukprot:Opistho-1_new@51192
MEAIVRGGHSRPLERARGEGCCVRGPWDAHDGRLAGYDRSVVGDVLAGQGLNAQERERTAVEYESLATDLHFRLARNDEREVIRRDKSRVQLRRLELAVARVKVFDLRLLDEPLEHCGRDQCLRKRLNSGGQVGQHGGAELRGKRRLLLEFREHLRIVHIRRPRALALLIRAASLYVGLVENFGLQKLLEHVLQRGNADVFVEGIAGARVVDALDDGNVRLALPEFLEHLVQTRVDEDLMQGALSHREDGLERHAFVRVDECEVAEVQNGDDVGAVAVVDGHATVPAIHNQRHRLEVQFGAELQHKHVLEFRHYVTDLLERKLERALEHFDLLLAEVRVVRSQLQQFFQLRTLVDDAHLLAEEEVEQLRDGKRQREREHHEEFRDPYRLGADCEGLPRTRRLRHDFAEDDDGEGGPEHGHEARRDALEEDRERVVDEHVAEEQRAQQVIALLSHGENRLCVLALFRRARLHNDLKARHVEAHEAEVEPGEQTRQREQKYDHEDLCHERN